MFPRIWILALTVLLLVAPAHAVAAEVTDTQAELSADEVVPCTPIVPIETPPALAIRCLCSDLVPSTPVLAGIFRPPRLAPAA